LRYVIVLQVEFIDQDLDPRVNEDIRAIMLRTQDPLRHIDVETETTSTLVVVVTKAPNMKEDREAQQGISFMR